MLFRSLLVKLVLLFGCRPGEIAQARRAEFDLKQRIWTIPPERHKTGKATGRPLKRPIIDEMSPLIEEAMQLSHNPE